MISNNVAHFRAIVLACSFVIFTFSPYLTEHSAAQESAPSDSSPSRAAATSDGGAKPSAQASPVDLNGTDKAENTETNKDKPEKKERKGSFVFAPLPIVSPAIGSGIVPFLGYIFPFQTRDENSPPSLVGLAGLITDNDTRAFALAGDIYFKQASYNLKSLYFRGNLDYNLYGVGYTSGNAGLKLPLEQTGQLFFIEFLRALPWKFFVGGRFLTGNSSIRVKDTTGETPPIPADAALDTQLRALGVTVTRDSRPNRFYPVEGSLIDFTGDFFADSLGSKYTFQSYNLTYNKYFSLGKKQVFAYNLFLCATGGEPPFYGNCIYGARNELRGYTAGRYLDRYMFATQLEYRLVLRWRLGWLALAGLVE